MQLKLSKTKFKNTQTNIIENGICNARGERVCPSVQTKPKPGFLFAFLLYI